MVSRTEGYYRRKDGTLVPIETRRRPLNTENGWIIVGTARDITERRIAERESRESETKYRDLTEFFASYSWEVDADLRFTTAQGRGLREIGLRAEELIGKRSAELKLDWTILSPPHAEFDRIRAQHLPYRDVLTRLRLADGSERYLSLWGQPRFADDGRFLGYRGVTQDVTERVSLEQKVKELNESLELRVAERTAALEHANRELESFTYSVAHDLRAPLRAIAAFSDLIREKYAPELPEQGRLYLQRVEQNAVQMHRLMDALLELSQTSRKHLTRSAVNMHDLADAVAQECRKPGEAQPHIDIGEMPPAFGDPTLLRQVWRNLIGNAVKFSSKVPAPRVEAGFSDSSIGPAYFVRDNGAGFDMNYADKLFGIFQRLHTPAEFEGTGVGLALVKRIVERHGGRVCAESQPGQGAVFRFSLPQAP